MTKAVFFGSSSVEGAGASEPRKRFSSIAAQALGWEEINLGIGGTTVIGRDAEGQVTDEHSGLGRVTDVLDAKPDVVVILYGANDFGQGLPLGTLEQFQQGTYVWDYDTMLRGLLYVLHPGQVVLSTLQYRSDAETPNAQGLMLQDYNAAIRQLGARYDVRVLDAYLESGIDAKNWPDLSADESHLNDAGYQRLAGFFIEALRPVGGSE